MAIPEHFRGQGRHAVLVGEISRVDKRLSAERLDLLLGVQVALVSLDEDYVGARASKGQSHGLADAARATRDNGQVALEREELFQVSWCHWDLCFP